MKHKDSPGRLFGAAEIRLGRQRSPQHESGPNMTRYLRAANVQDGQVDLSDVKEMNFDPSEQHVFGLRRGDVLVTEGSGSLRAVGASAVWDAELPGKVCFQNTLIRLRPRAGVDARYLAWWTRAAYADGQFAAIAAGANIYHLSAERLKGMSIALPSVSEQVQIVDFLDDVTRRINALIAARRRQIELLEMRSRSRLSTLADGLGARHGFVKVRHVLRKIEQGWSPQCEDRLAETGEWGVLKAGCVNGGVFDPFQHKALPATTDPELRYRIRPGDLLVSRASGSLDLIGSAGVVPPGVSNRLLLCDKVYRLRVDERRATADFVALMLSTHRIRQSIRLGVSGAEGMANNLPTATVVNLPVPDAPLVDQARVVAEVLDWRLAASDARDLLTRQLAVLAERRQALIAAAVTGQIDVSTASGVSA